MNDYWFLILHLNASSVVPGLIAILLLADVSGRVDSKPLYIKYKEVIIEYYKYYFNQVLLT